ncbi:MAG: hypothetical protein JO356_07625 [Acidobacteria bacterium]|nr:hypothetical protein [Acidobacteriota bacterium]
MISQRVAGDPLSDSSQAEQTSISQMPFAVFDDGHIPVLDSEDSTSPLASIQGELMSLSVRQAEVEQRIQYIRQALVTLVHVFGPEILVPSDDAGR